jgi:sarcosine oxidase subunit alpha
MATRAPIRFWFRGRERTGGPGQTLLGTLARGALPTLQRSIRYHRPRAPFCGVGYCTHCLVRVNGVPNVRACRYFPQPNDRVETENAWPSPAHDLLGGLDLLFFQGIDTLRGFRWPAWAAPVYQRVVRRLAGYGRLADPAIGVPDPEGSGVVPSQSLDSDVLVIGAGPAGRRAAERVAAANVSVRLVDRGPIWAPPPGVTALAHTTVVFLPPPGGGSGERFRALAVSDHPRASWVLRARTVIAATGAYDGGLLFLNNDRPGVLTAEGALALAGETGDPPFRHALVFGGGERAAQLLDRFGAHVDHLAAPGGISPGVVRRATELDIPLYPRTVILSVSGRARVRQVRVLARGTRNAFPVRADAIVLAHRRLPQNQVLFHAGARMEWRAAAAGYFPVIGPAGTTTVPGLFAVGEVAGHVDKAGIEGSGIAAADAAVGRDGRSTPPPSSPAVPEPPSEFVGYYEEFLRHRRMGGKRVACLCEDVLLEEIEDASRRGFRGLEVVKRYTGLGTGLCQGRYCVPDGLLILALLEARSPPEVGYITQRPPVIPAPLDALAAAPAPYGAENAERP